MGTITKSLFMLASATALLTGCPDRTISEVNPQQGRVETKDIPVKVNRQIDILFLIDDSVSMADKQTNLAANFPQFINVLSTIPGGLPDVHIGVATSDMGGTAADGTNQPVQPGSLGGCNGTGGKNGVLQLGMATGAVTGNFISDVANGASRQTNYTGTLADTFGKMAQVGATGCGFEQHLEAVKHALDATNTAGANKGFLRKDAYLAVIFIQDEDDCSINHATLLQGTALGPLQSFRCTRYGVTCDVGGKTPDEMNSVGTKDQCHSNESGQYLTKVADYVTFLKSLKEDPANVIVAGIAGVTDTFQVANLPPPNDPNGTKSIQLVHSCNYVGAPSTDNPTGIEYGDPATRLQFFLSQFPNRNTFTSVCQKDLTDALNVIAGLLKTVIGDPCIEGVLAEPYDCSVSYVTNPNKANQTEQVLAECNTAVSNKPCWHLVKDATNCSMTPSQLTLKIENDSTPPDNTHEIANCVTVPQ